MSAYTPLRERSVEELVEGVRVSATLNRSEAPAMAAVIARCTIELAEKTDLASKVLDNAQVQMSVRLNRLANEIKESREAMAAAATGSAKHSEALNRWTKALVFVTVVYTVVTAVGVAVTVYQELRPSSPTEVEGVAPVLPEVRSRGSGSPS